MRILKKFLSPLNLTATLVSAGVAMVLAWLVKDKITPYLLGTTFDERGPVVKAAILLGLVMVFFIYIVIVQAINKTLDDQSRFKPPIFLAIIGGLTGAFAFLFIFGPGTLNGARVDWLMGGLDDNAMHYLGWVFYRHDPWAFPLTYSQSLGYPFGVSVSLTDPVTLFILPFKALSAILPETFQYFGLWTLTCFILQGALSALLVYEVTKNRLAAFLAPAFFCLATILIYRVYTYIPHVGQWTILAGLYLYFQNRHKERVSGWWPAVLCAGLLAQPYFVGIIGVAFLAAMLERLIFNRDWRGAVALTGISVAAVWLVMIVTGMSGGDYDMSGASVDYFKTNLNSLVNPVNKGWSVFLPPLPLAENTYPNLHYLGFGMILLASFGLGSFLFTNWRGLGKILKRNGVLIGMMVGLTILSLGNVVTLNDKILFDYHLPEPMMKAWTVFRATERFLWPAFYLIFLFAIAQTVRTLRRERWIAAALLLTLGLQYADLAPLIQQKYETFAEPRGSESPLTSDFWTDAGSQYKSLVMLSLNLKDWDWLTNFAADNRMTTNYFYFGRPVEAISTGAEKQMQALSDGQFGEGEVYVLTDSEMLKKVCGPVREGLPLAYVDGQFVLAPGFQGELSAYPDVAVTGDTFECGTVSLADYLERHRDKLVVLSVKEDGAQAMDETGVEAMQSLGLTTDLRGQVGKSYIGIALDGQALFEQIGDGRIDFAAGKGKLLEGVNLPAELHVSSAGRISGEEFVEIVIDDKDYSFGRRGLNVSVIDPESGEVINTALFEMLEDTTNY